MSVFGFSTEISEGGDFTPIVKYDARAGRVFRVDRIATGDGFSGEPVDITHNFKAVFDFENIEVGWARFAANAAPSFSLVLMGSELPPRPSPDHKNVIRLLIKLNKTCGGDRQVREIAFQAKTALSGVEKVYEEYKREKAKYPGQLPVISLESTTPVTASTGATKTTNYKPNFRIDGWATRPADLVYTQKTATNGGAQPQQTAPSTGSTAMPPPKAAPQQPADDNDFG